MFAHPAAWWLLLVLPTLGLLHLWSRRRGRTRIANFGVIARTRAWPRRLLRSLTLLLLILALVGPRWGQARPTPSVPGRDLIVVLDLSRSMLAEDALPSRLERARRMLQDLSRDLQRQGGHRLALVAFAGRARVICPLTGDQVFFRLALDGLDARVPPTDLLPHGTEGRSGTNLQGGLEAALTLVHPDRVGWVDILVLSDGDDPVPSDDWQEAAAEARLQGTPIHVVGLGDPIRDSPIPITPEEVLRYNGQQVGTHLHEDRLRALAASADGSYLPARTQPFDLTEWFRRELESRGVQAWQEESLREMPPRRDYFLAGALVLGLLDLIGLPGWLARDRRPW